MTVEDVAQAKQALEAEGLYPSLNRIVARIGGSKRDVARHMATLADASSPEGLTSVLDVDAPVGVGPVLSCPDRDASTDRGELGQAHAALLAALQAAEVLGVEAHSLKQQRQALQHRTQACTHALRVSRTDEAVDQTRAALAALAQAEAVLRERCTRLDAKRAEAAATVVACEDAYRALRTRADTLLLRFRRAQAAAHDAREAQNTYAKVLAEDEAQSSMERLTPLIGSAAAQAGAAETTRRPWWRGQP